MHSEDDTFRKLKRVPFNLMESLVRKWVFDHHDSREVEEVLHAHGWTKDEYDDYVVD